MKLETKSINITCVCRRAEDPLGTATKETEGMAQLPPISPYLFSSRTHVC